MSTIKSSDEHLTINADGSSKDIKFQANGVEKASISSSGAFTSTTIDATKLTGDLPAISGANLTGISSVGGATGVDFNDNVKARFGTGNDLEIYHDHANSQNVLLSTSIPTVFASNDLNFANGANDTFLMSIKNDGTVGIGTTPETWNSSLTALQIGEVGVLAGGNTAWGGYFEVGANYYRDSSNFKFISADKACLTEYQNSTGKIKFKTTTAGSADGVITWKEPFTICHQSVTGGDWCTILNQSIEPNGTVYYMNFTLDGSGKGAIRGTSNSVSYNTSSDYRLKENVDYTWDATTRLKQLKPCRFNWISDDTNTTLDGFLAHEVTGIVPEAAHGIKDETETYTDDDGNEQTRPVYQGIDQSKLVPLLVKTIQELEARITALES